MRNVTITVDKKAKKATIVLDLSKGGQQSASGKTMVLATTEGNKQVEPNLYIGVNCYTKPGDPA